MPQYILLPKSSPPLTFSGVSQCRLFGRGLTVNVPFQNISCRRHIGLINGWVIIVFHQPEARMSAFTKMTENPAHPSWLTVWTDSPVHCLFYPLVSCNSHSLFPEKHMRLWIHSFSLTFHFDFFEHSVEFGNQDPLLGHSRPVPRKAHLQQALQCCLLCHVDLKHSMQIVNCHSEMQINYTVSKVFIQRLLMIND